ncbi:MAG: ribonuclease E/G [Alphaproteobacteria bacterium]|nr:ribonuclease E/G [Alphaproteobacteria bacterium]
MTKRMLIDASHPEETRVVVLDGSRVEEFDFEAASKRPLKGNIYLAKVTRVEPSLQAAFVEYGGNRQGFLAFSEIHPDYYQIPVADRQALLAEQEAEARRRQEDEIESFDIGRKAPDAAEPEEDEEEEQDQGEEAGDIEMAPLVPLDAAPEGETSGAEDGARGDADEDEDEVFDNQKGRPAIAEEASEDVSEDDDENTALVSKTEAAAADLADYRDDGEVAAAGAAEENEGEIEPVSPHPSPEQAVGDFAGENAGEQAAEAAAEGETADAQALHAPRPPQKWVRKKHYKIQEVIKRRQIILVQVVKEERGNKGAALTTYLSLAGRYCVLMPNTPRGGGISRKITNAADRKRLKSAAQGLDLPEGMGLIIRTAGENRTKLEIRRDYEYLVRLWDTIREKTLSSNAPACVYEEGDLIKRVIRDLYTKDVQDIVVEGEEGYHNAREFMRMLMPSHARNVHHYKDKAPLFQRMHIEAQLDSMFSPTVTLKSGGYIVINQTEALVSIDVNSGRATREHSIEETARKTNLEAAAEIGRQLRLRDLAGLIVIDFIDMEESRNDREVERRLRDAVKNDRARVQIGKISQFGLMEMSRQRLRAGVIAGSTITCPHCAGMGIVRSVESTALRLLRALEEEGEKNRSAAVTVKIANDVALYVLNQKRHELDRIETEHEMEIVFVPSEGMAVGTFEIERTRQRNPADRPRQPLAVGIEAGFAPSDEPEIAPEEQPEEEEPEEEDEEEEVQEAQPEVEGAEAQARAESEGTTGENGEQRGGRRSRWRSRRRGRRGGRRRNQPNQGEEPGAEAQGQQDQGDQNRTETVGGDIAGSQHGRRDGGDQPPQESTRTERAPRDRGGRARRAVSETDRFGLIPDEIDTTPSETPSAPGKPSAPVWSLSDDIPDTTPSEDAAEAPKPTRKGWWQRTFSGE